MIATVIALCVVIADSLFQILMYMKIDYREVLATKTQELEITYQHNP